MIWRKRTRGGPALSIAVKALALCAAGVLSLLSTALAADFVQKWDGTRHDWVFALAQRGQDRWAGGSFGLMVQKAGGQWTPKVETYPLSVLSIGFAPNGTGVATGNMGLLLEMQPNSDDWVRHKYNATNRLFSVAASPANEFLVSGAYGTLLDRPPNGAWKVIPLGFTGMAIPNLYAVHFLDARKAVIAGESGTIVTLDSGKITKSAAVRESLFAVTSCGGMITAGGQSGMIETSEDGLVWHPSRIPGNPDLYGFGCLPDGRLVASSSWMYMVGTRQGAAWTWQEIRPPGDIPWFQAILPTDSSNVLISGQGGIWQTGLTNGAK